MWSWKEETPAEYINISYFILFKSWGLQVAEGSSPHGPGSSWKETMRFPKCRSFRDRARALEQEEGKRRQRNPVPLPAAPVLAAVADEGGRKGGLPGYFK